MSIIKTANLKLSAFIRVPPFMTDFNIKFIFNSSIKGRSLKQVPRIRDKDPKKPEPQIPEPQTPEPGKSGSASVFNSFNITLCVLGVIQI